MLFYYQCLNLIFALLISITILAGMDEDEAFFDASKAARFEVMNELLKQGADINFKSWKFSLSPLHSALLDERLDVAKWLVENGAEVNKKFKKTHYRLAEGATPLHLVACHSHSGWIELADQLIIAGAAVNAVDNEGWTPLHQAAAYNDTSDMVSLLLKMGAHVNAITLRADTPLHFAAGYEDLVKVLIENNADTLIKDEDGKIPLHIAVEYRSPNAIKLLLPQPIWNLQDMCLEMILKNIGQANIQQDFFYYLLKPRLNELFKSKPIEQEIHRINRTYLDTKDLLSRRPLDIALALKKRRDESRMCYVAEEVNKEDEMVNLLVFKVERDRFSNYIHSLMKIIDKAS